MSERHPALVELRAANAAWDKHGGGPSSLLAVADAGARQVVEYLDRAMPYPGVVPRDVWCRLRAAVGLDKKEGEADAD